MRFMLASTLMALTALPVGADVSEAPIPDGQPMAVDEILADLPASAPTPNPPAVTAQNTPAVAIPAAPAPEEATDQPEAADATAEPPDASSPVTVAEPAPATDAPASEVTTADSATTESVTGESTATTEPPAATQEGTQAEIGSAGAVDTPATAPAPGQDGTAAANAGTTGWTGGTGGARLGTTPSGAVPESKTWQPPVATGIDLKGNASS
ncbi:hypothetical protein [Paracoccus xiamenensis]|uniref:hypothetical protein n=1 Tax=Paracoccus xiamenensis TaxID=2714901 RepID=UPI001409D80E|nr:hypothetical protein [Paracoccus xiamenensis]NHF72287.1 hypothetical protein [Paracoccus xiamenensis]